MIPVAPPPPPPEDLGTLTYWPIYSDASNAAYQEFLGEATEQLEQRKAKVDGLKGRGDWEKYRTEARQKIFELVGPLPDKTPLNPRVVGVVDKGTYRIEKVVYESQPGFNVTAALFVPQPLKAPAPGILYCSGHSDLAFRSINYTASCVNLVSKGFVVLAFDPIGQGERLQYIDPVTGLSEYHPGSSTREHSRAGSQYFVLGDSLARPMIWDGIRSIDYLLTRPEVDPKRLGITGRSGGGTQTAYIAAMDDRIHAAAPEVYITDFYHLLRQSGPQDAEQNFYRGLARGFDIPDLLLARAPKPTLILSTTRDIFSLTGARHVYSQLQRAHAALGGRDTAQHSIADGVHESPLPNREAMYAFFQKHLGNPGDKTYFEVQPLPAEDLRITPTGQVNNSIRGETAFTLNRRRAAQFVAQLDERRRDLAKHLPVVKQAAAQLSGFQKPDGEPGEPLFAGSHLRPGYTIEKYVLPVNERYGVPLIAFVPDTKPKHVVLYLNAAGKTAAAGPGGEMEALLRQGCAVVAPDLFGSGELGKPTMPIRGEPERRLWYSHVLMGTSTLGRQAEDVLRAMRFAQDRFGVSPKDQFAIARGNFGPLLLHVAAIENAFARVALLASPLSFRGFVTTEYYDIGQTPAMVPGALPAYDLPDLGAALAPRRLLIADPRGGDSKPATAEALALDTAVIRRAYAAGPNSDQLKIVAGEDPAALATSLADWLR